MANVKYTELMNKDATYLMVRTKYYNDYHNVKITVQEELQHKVIHVTPETLKQRGFNLEYMVKRKN